MLSVCGFYDRKKNAQQKITVKGNTNKKINPFLKLFNKLNNFVQEFFYFNIG